MVQEKDGEKVCALEREQANCDYSAGVKSYLAFARGACTVEEDCKDFDPSSSQQVQENLDEWLEIRVHLDGHFERDVFEHTLISYKECLPDFPFREGEDDSTKENIWCTVQIIALVLSERPNKLSTMVQSIISKSMSYLRSKLDAKHASYAALQRFTARTSS